MKNIIETSCYLLIMTIICYISLEFIIMNIEIADVGKMQQYVSHYIEIYGKTQKNNDELDSAVLIPYVMLRKTGNVGDMPI